MEIENEENVFIPYINYKSEFSYRQIYPCSVNYETSNIYHKDSWVMTSVDTDKNSLRSFSFNDIIKGVIHHTLKEVAVTSTPERVNGVFNKIKENYIEQ